MEVCSIWSLDWSLLGKCPELALEYRRRRRDKVGRVRSKEVDGPSPKRPRRVHAELSAPKPIWTDDDRPTLTARKMSRAPGTKVLATVAISAGRNSTLKRGSIECSTRETSAHWCPDIWPRTSPPDTCPIQ